MNGEIGERVLHDFYGIGTIEKKGEYDDYLVSFDNGDSETVLSHLIAFLGFKEDSFKSDPYGDRHEYKLPYNESKVSRIRHVLEEYGYSSNADFSKGKTFDINPPDKDYVRVADDGCGVFYLWIPEHDQMFNPDIIESYIEELKEGKELLEKINAIVFEDINVT